MSRRIPIPLRILIRMTEAETMKMEVENDDI